MAHRSFGRTKAKRNTKVKKFWLLHVSSISPPLNIHLTHTNDDDKTKKNEFWFVKNKERVGHKEASFSNKRVTRKEEEKKTL